MSEIQEIVLNHCNLPIECPAICDNLREIPEEDGVHYISFCIKPEGCPYAVPTTHYFKDKKVNEYPIQEE